VADILIENVVKQFGNFRAVDDVSLAIRDGEFVSLLGPSGCGKTTLLRIVAGLESETSGRILIGGRSVNGLAPRDRGLAMVFQNYAVFPHMTVFENIAFGLRMQKRNAAVVKEKVAMAAALLHIEEYLDRYPARLSGGQRQRVAVARALAVEPKLLLMDEPLSNLDALLRLEMRTELKSVLRKAGTTTIYVTHDQTEAMGLSDRIAVMHRGKIDQIGDATEVYARPASRFVGGFLGNPPMNFIRLPVIEAGIRLGARAVPVPANTGSEAEIGMRGEELRLVAREEGLPFTIGIVEAMGSHQLVTGWIGGQQVRVVAPSDLRLESGAEVGLAVDPAKLTWIDPASGRALARQASHIA
jgi:multiple sugar transport system ATP-binding protein